MTIIIYIYTSNHIIHQHKFMYIYTIIIHHINPLSNFMTNRPWLHGCQTAKSATPAATPAPHLPSWDRTWHPAAAALRPGHLGAETTHQSHCEKNLELHGFLC